jgi:hypothetical protein
MLAAIVAMASVLPALAQGPGLTAPRQGTAGNALSLGTSGSGSATLFLIGPGSAAKREVQLGQAVELNGDELSSAGRYVALLCGETCRSTHFYVVPSAPAALSFLAHPSRALVRQGDAISGVVFPFDRFGNLVTTPLNVSFRMTANNTNLFSSTVPTRLGVAWFRAPSGGRAGLAQLTASVQDLSSTRALQLVASDPCNLRITGQQTANGILVETAPVRDCSGNTVPDGTIVTFTANSSAGLSTVDAPIKQGVARAQLAGSGATLISAASGVVMGNELRMMVKP